jgi:hypothetical protein
MFADAPLRLFFFLFAFFLFLPFFAIFYFRLYLFFISKKKVTRLYLFFFAEKEGNNVKKNGDASHSPILAEEMYFQADDLQF